MNLSIHYYDKKREIYRIISPPTFNEVEDDSMYKILTRYQNYLVYELLSPEIRTYNSEEQTMYIVNALRLDERLLQDLLYA